MRLHSVAPRVKHVAVREVRLRDRFVRVGGLEDTQYQVDVRILG
jgi:hypothetical protein